MSTAKSPFHRGEKEIQSRLGIAEKMEAQGRRMIRDHMPEEHQAFFSQLPLLIVKLLSSITVRILSQLLSVLKDLAASLTATCFLYVLKVLH